MSDDIEDLISEVGNSLLNYASKEYVKIGDPADKRYENACEAIRTKFDALNQRIAELEAAQRWIPVSEPPKECEWKAYVPGWGAPTVNKRYLVKLINDWITIATYYLHVGGGYWKDDRGQELADGVVSLWKGLEE